MNMLYLNFCYVDNQFKICYDDYCHNLIFNPFFLIILFAEKMMKNK